MKINKFPRPFPAYCIQKSAFSSEETEKIIDLEDLQKFAKGTVGVSQEQNNKIRDSQISWLHHDQNSDWLFQKFAFLTSQANYEYFMYDIDGFDAFQYTKYSTEEHYDWHIDLMTGSPYFEWERKISASIMLSDPSEYGGGEFELIPHGNINSPIKEKLQKGDVVYFASWMPHKVHPVTSGVRKTLVAWIMGKRQL